MADGLRGALQRFKTDSNNLRWGDLGGALVGALLYQLFTGWIAIIDGIATGFSRLVGGVVDGVDAGGFTLATTITNEAAAAWAPLDGGLFGFALNAIVVLAAFTAVAYAVGVIG